MKQDCRQHPFNRSSSEWPPKELEQVSHCPVCKSQKRSLLYDDLTDRVFFCAPGKWNMYVCEECGSAYLDPRPSQDSIGLAYESYFTHSPEPVRADFLTKLKRGLKNGYINYRYSAAFQPSLPLGYWLVSLLPQRIMVDEYVRHLPLATPGAKLLDIGCGNGSFLHIARQLGWQTWGCDKDESALKIASQSGAKVFKVALPNIDLPDNLFDIITLSHVIEHVHDPALTLREIHRLLKPGGSLWLATPNLDSEGAKLFRQNWLHLDSPRHLCLFTPSSISALLKAEGFGVPNFKKSTLARPSFTASYRVSIGVDPFSLDFSYIPLTIRIRAIISDILSLFDPLIAEQIVLVATAEK